MTEEQIAALHRKVEFGLKIAEDEPIGSTGTEWSIRRGFMREMPLAIQRLLEERRRLLEALRDAERSGMTSQTEDGIRAAIAFAEEATP